MRKISPRKMRPVSCAFAGRRRKPYSSGMDRMGQAFCATLDLFQTGVDVMRQNLRRRHRDATEQEIEHLLGRWMRKRPGAEAGDCPGRRIDENARFA